MPPVDLKRWIAGAILCSTACGRPSDGSVNADPPPLAEAYKIFGDTEGAPPSCEMESVAARLAELFTAITEGEPAIGEQFFVSDNDPSSDWSFKWFSFSDTVRGGGGTFTTFSADSLDAYFGARHTAGDKLVLRGVKFIGWVAARGTVGLSPIMFDYSVRDASTGVRRTRHGFGKGEYHCASSAFMVMSIGTTEEQMWRTLWRTLGTPNGR